MWMCLAYNSCLVFVHVIMRLRHKLQTTLHFVNSARTRTQQRLKRKPTSLPHTILTFAGVSKHAPE